MKIAKCLELLELTPELLTSTTGNVMKVVKKAFLKAALLHHPDKHGDQVVFIGVQNAWDSLRAA
eukprot:3112018-Prymnesium_polylepis.1